LGLGTQSRLGCRSDTGKPPPQLASRGRGDGHAGGPFQVIFIHASPAPAQGHRREDTLLAEVGSYLPHRCPPPVRLYSRLTGLHNRQTAPDGRLAPAPAACSLPRARTEETRGPKASQWGAKTTQLKNPCASASYPADLGLPPTCSPYLFTWLPDTLPTISSWSLQANHSPYTPQESGASFSLEGKDR
jgi:hypothetical protein